MTNVRETMNFLGRHVPVVNSARAVAEEEVLQSSLPGFLEGPADAARHIIGAAETRRRAGLTYARTVVDGNEYLGARAGSRPDSTEMDNHNNSIGLSIGATARTYDEVIRMTREAMDRGIERGGTGVDNTPMWLQDPGRWKEPDFRTNRPSSDAPIHWQPSPSSHNYPYGGEEYRSRLNLDSRSRLNALLDSGLTGREAEARLLADLAQVPSAYWSEEDVRAVIRSQPYRDSRDPTRAVWHARVRAYFEEKVRQEQKGEAQEEGARAAVGDEQAAATDISNRADGNGTVDVSAYTRRGKHGAVQVSAHQRSAPG